MIDDMKERGIVKPSTSPWASPVILVLKRDGMSHFCIDYRCLNAVTTKDVYLLPRIDDILDTLGEAKYFSSLYLASGYWQVEFAPDARQTPPSRHTRGCLNLLGCPLALVMPLLLFRG